MIGPPPNEWPPNTIAWCQRCDRPIKHGTPYQRMDNGLGFRHRLCVLGSVQ